MDPQSEKSIDSWLDLWEELRQSRPDLDAPKFVEEYKESIAPELREELQQKILAIQEIDQVLRNRAGRVVDQVGEATVKPREVVLVPGLEPIRGYVLQSLLGSGGSGQVWKALGPGGYEVAMKFVSLGSRTLKTETRSLELIRRVKNPRILEVFGSWQRYGFLIIATELADSSLFDRLQECLADGSTGINRDELLNYMKDAAEGLDFLNTQSRGLTAGGGIQHRDIKPQNLLLVGDRVKIADLGIARSLDRSETGHTGPLSLSYAAPEFFEGKTTSTSDQYSLAVTYLQLRTGSLPFSGNPHEVFLGHLAKTADLTGLPLNEQVAVGRALSKRPVDRWPNCRAFVDALEEANPDRASQTEKSGSSCLRQPVTGRLLAVATCLASLAVLIPFLGIALKNRNQVAQKNAEQKLGTQADPEIDRTSQIAPTQEVSETSQVSNSKTDQTMSNLPVDSQSAAADQVLIGLRLWEGKYGVNHRSRAVGGVQAIFATQAGIVESPGFGFTQGRSTTVVAETGYVVGRIELRWTNDRMGGMLIEFVRFQEGHLSVQDNYSVEYQRRSVLDAGIDAKEVIGDLTKAFTGIQARAPNQELTFFQAQECKGRIPEAVGKIISGQTLGRQFHFGQDAAGLRLPMTLESLHKRFGTVSPSEIQTGIAEEFGLPVEKTSPSGLVFRLIPLLDLAGKPLGYLSATEVTVGQFREFTAAASYTTMAEEKVAGGEGLTRNVPALVRSPAFHWRTPGFLQTDRHPVINLGFRDANEYCQWLSQKDNGLFRLPSAEEWAAAAGDDSSQAPANFGMETWDDQRNPLLEIGPTSPQESASDGFALTAPVGTYPANSLGFFDLYGNAREWTQSGYPDPIDQRRWSASQRILVGGSFLQKAPQTASASHSVLNDWERQIDTGFRVFWELPANTPLRPSVR